MRFFALDTNIENIKQRYMAQGEKEIMTVYYHGMSFFFAVIRQTIFTVIIFAIGLAGGIAGIPLGGLIGVLFFIWFFFVFNSILKAYLDWNHDFIFITTDKIVLYDQTSVFHHMVTPINMENFASVSSSTQFFNVFNFGALELNLKEGAGERIVLKYIPHAGHVAAQISQCVTTYQRRNPVAS